MSEVTMLTEVPIWLVGKATTKREEIGNFVPIRRVGHENPEKARDLCHHEDLWWRNETIALFEGHRCFQWKERDDFMKYFVWQV